MLRSIQRGILTLALVTAYACGNDSGSSTSPTSPSGSGGAIVTGVVANGSASTQSVSVSGAHVMAVAGVQRVEVVGTNISSGVDNEGRFSLAGVPDGSVVLRFSGTGVNATVNISGVGSGQTISIIVTITGATAAIVADSRNPEAGQMPVNGIVSGLTGSAMSFQFVVNGLTIHGDAQTQFFGNDDKSASFADLKNGVRVEVKTIARTSGLYAFRLHINKERG
jgi:hypothetical protein